MILGANGTSANCVNYVAFAIPKPEETTTTTTETTTTTTETTTTTTVSTPTAQKTMTGDVNCSGAVDVSDAVLLARFIAEDVTANITQNGKLNADCDDDGTITSADTLQILRYIAKMITFEN